MVSLGEALVAVIQEMEALMSIIDSVKGWVFGIALKKGIKSAAKLIVSFAVAHGIKLSVAVHGVAINTTDEAGLVVAINSGLKVLFNWIKVKWPKFSWLP